MSKNILTHLKIVEACGKANVPAMLVGAPGIGKTAILEKFAESIGYDLNIQLLSAQDNTDVTGLPARVQQDNIFTTDYATPKYQLDIINKPKTLLFLDEMNNGMPSVQSAWLTILQSRRFPNGMKMNNDTWIVGAMNPREQSADGWDLSLATTNRICFIPFEVPFSYWKSFMIETQEDLTFMTDNLSEEDIHRSELNWKLNIIKFLESSEGKLYEQHFPQVDADPVVYGAVTLSEQEIFKMAWSSRRSWYNAAKVLSYLGNDKIAINIALNGLVGYAAATEFLDFIESESKLPSPIDILDNPAIIDWKNENRIDQVNRLMRSVIKIKDRDEQMYDLFMHILKCGRADIAVPYIYNEDGNGFISIYRGKRDLAEILNYWEEAEDK